MKKTKLIIFKEKLYSPIIQIIKILKTEYYKVKRISIRRRKLVHNYEETCMGITCNLTILLDFNLSLIYDRYENIAKGIIKNEIQEETHSRFILHH